jgi:CTP synthase (UTP-ammonia lyase)
MIRRATRTHQAYGRRIKSVEAFRCSFGLAPNYRQKLMASALEVTAVGPDGEARAFALRDYPFCIATLFVALLSASGQRQALRSSPAANPRPSATTDLIRVELMS